MHWNHCCVSKWNNLAVNISSQTIFFYVPTINMKDRPSEETQMLMAAEKVQFFIWIRQNAPFRKQEVTNPRNEGPDRSRGRHTKLSSMLEHSRNESTSRGLISCCWSAASMLSGHPAASRLKAAWKTIINWWHSKHNFFHRLGQR